MAIKSPSVFINVLDFSLKSGGEEAAILAPFRQQLTALPILLKKFSVFLRFSWFMNKKQILREKNKPCLLSHLHTPGQSL